MSQESSLLLAQDVRIDAEGAMLCEGLSCNITSPWAVLAGSAVQAIASVLCRRARLTRGTLLIDGHDVGSGQHLHRVGLAPLVSYLPPSTTVLEYVRMHFELAGWSSRQASHHAQDALQQVGLGPLAKRRSDSLVLAERRAVSLVQALLPETQALFAESPLASLEGPSAQYVLDVLKRLSQHRRLLLTVSRLDSAGAERDLILNAGHLVLLGRGGLQWMGSPDQLFPGKRWFTLTVHGEAQAFTEQLAQRGYAVQGQAPRLIVGLAPETDSSQLFALAQETQAVIVELMPVLSAL